ncbi:E3 ubiquitin-protein ligase SDIR1 isoform X1 [Amaranthus tricolor]|uniref:E3 ubiquitin-protein ligase SDIR1 isoform X1 n=1 Tax=Amaranthus tricolor TaxID=29722 RepID=UPI002584FE17|nr:E3 ubiquitin-protein ligase SDIR1 isoform X1 [Amaranthus tricolor]
MNRGNSNRDGLLRWDQRYNSQYNQRNGAPLGYRSFEERPPILRPSSLTSVPLDPLPATRIIVVGNNTGHGVSPMFPLHSQPQLIPRFIDQESTRVPTQTDNSKLTKDEQEMALKKLKKEIYNPMPKILARRVSLYYRDLNKGVNTKAFDKHNDEDRKSCTVCLEDFNPREEVMLTPCNHMFHEECIVPWVKDNGLCPVCRATFYERRQNDLDSSNNTRVVQLRPVGQPVQFHDDLFSLIRVMDEFIPWGL